MANQILAGAVFQAGQVIAGVDADNPPYVGPQIPYILFGGNWTDDPQIMNALTGETTAVPSPTSGTGIDGTDGIGRNQIHVADGMVIMVGYTSITVYTDLSVAGTTLPHPPGGLNGNVYNFGKDVHVVGDYIYVGTQTEDNHLGTIQIYNKNTLQWHSELKPTNPWYSTVQGAYFFGQQFAITEATDLTPRSLWVGVPYDDQAASPGHNSGKVYRFTLDADGLPTGSQGQEVGDGITGSEYGAFTDQSGVYVAFGYGPGAVGETANIGISPYNGKINLTNTEYGPGGLGLTSGMTDYWDDPSSPYSTNNFGSQDSNLVVTDDYVIVGNSHHKSPSHNNGNPNDVPYGALYFYERYGVEDNWTTTTPVYTFIAENDSPTTDGLGCWLVECDGKLYVGTRSDVALVFNLSDIQATPAQISRPDVIADSIWGAGSGQMGPQLLPSSMVPPPAAPTLPTTWTQAAGTSQDWDLEVVSGQAFNLTIDTGSGASTGVNLFDENGNYVYGWSQDWTLNIGWTPSSSGTYQIRFNSNPHHGDTTFTVTSTSGLA